MNAAQSPRRITDPTTVDLWREYEASARTAHQQYLLMPSCMNAQHSAWPCKSCDRRTVSYSGVCRRCQKAAQ